MDMEKGLHQQCVQPRIKVLDVVVPIKGSLG